MRQTTKGTRKTENRQQHTCQRSHIQSIPSQIQRLLHSRTFRKKSGRNQGQPQPYNQSPPQGCKEDTHDRKGVPAV